MWALRNRCRFRRETIEGPRSGTPSGFSVRREGCVGISLLTLSCIEHRLGALLQQLDENNEKEQKMMYDLIMAYERLTDPESMGELYKVLAIKSDGISTVPGFGLDA